MQRYRTRRAPFPIHKAPRMPKNRTLYQARKHVCAKARLRNPEIPVREEKQHKHKLFGPDFLRTFLTLTLGCPEVKKFLPTTGAAGKRTFWCGRPRFLARTSMTRRVAEKLCTNPEANMTARDLAGLYTVFSAQIVRKVLQIFRPFPF